MPLALMVQPLALDPAEELIQVKLFLHFSTTFIITSYTSVHNTLWVLHWNGCINHSKRIERMCV
jgi:hypothetical protein